MHIYMHTMVCIDQIGISICAYFSIYGCSMYGVSESMALLLKPLPKGLDTGLKLCALYRHPDSQATAYLPMGHIPA